METSVSKTLDAYSQLLLNWIELKSARPSESDFTQFGQNLKYSSIDEFLDRIGQLIKSLDSKGYWTSSPEAAVAETPIANTINTANSLVVNARNNGISWLLSAGFLETLNTARQLIANLSRSQAALNKEIAKSLESKSEADIEAIISAADVAKKIVSLEIDTKQKFAAISENSEFIAAAKDTIATSAAEIANLSSQVEAASASIQALLDSTTSDHKEVLRLKAEAIAKEVELNEKIDAATKKISQTAADAEAASESVKTALKQVRDQGLAKSFYQRSQILIKEKRIWALAFTGSLATLFLVGMIFGLEYESGDPKTFLLKMAAKLSISAPLIWMGWYSAKQIGRLSKVQEDYEYKTASALAYQSYRDEIGILSNDELIEKLANLSITNFGENPVRLYDAGQNESHSPLHEALQKMDPEKIKDALVKLSEYLKESTKISSSK